MFTRPKQTYVVSDPMIDAILRDPANPLHQIAKLLPEGAKVLDVGAGSGILARVLQRDGKSVTIDAIEPDAFAVELARPFYRAIFQGYLSNHSQALKPIRYDYVILADVMEHNPDPAAFLADLVEQVPESA